MEGGTNGLELGGEGLQMMGWIGKTSNYDVNAIGLGGGKRF
jgi:hypothetical protein